MLSKSRFIEMFGDPNIVNKNASFEEMLIIRDDLRKPLNDSQRSQMREGVLYPYYGATGQVDTINKYLMDCTALCIAEDCGEYGADQESSYIVNGKCWVNNHAHVTIPTDECNIIYAQKYLQLFELGSFTSGTTRAKLTKAQLKKIPFFKPDLTLQNEYANFVSQINKSKFICLYLCYF